MKRIIALAALAAMVPLTAQAAEPPLKIGFISVFSGSAGILGNELYEGFTLALKDMNNTMAGRKVEVIKADSQLKPDVGRQLAQKMIQSDHVQIITGINFSNVMLAVAKPVLDSGTFLVSVNSGPSQYAGKLCNPLFFNAAFQNDMLFEAVGAYMQKEKVPDVYLMAPNYPAGRDMLTGFKRFYKGKIDAEIYSPLNQLDYSAEIAQLRAKKPTAVVFFYPGGMGINFVKQYKQAGLADKIPLYTGMGSVDQTTLGAIGDAALGITVVTNWSEYLDNPTSKKFVAEFKKAYHRVPSAYAADAYDTANAIAAALKATKGNISDKAAFEHALENVKYDSVRGSFKFNTNHFPIEDFYLTKIGKDTDGKLAGLLTDKKPVVEQLKDSYAKECHMAAAG